MARPDYSPAFEQKFIEVIELLLRQQSETESRRASVELEQRDLLEQLDQRLQTLAKSIETAAAQGFAVAAQRERPSSGNRVEPPREPNNASKPCDPLSEWERQKNLLLMGLEPNSHASVPAGELADFDSTAAREQVSPSDSAATPPTPLEWIEQLDPNDPALTDEAVRQDLVARLRQLEVELSLERAKLARDRSDLDSQLSEIQRAERQQSNGAAREGAAGKRKEQGKKDRMFRFLGRKSPEQP